MPISTSPPDATTAHPREAAANLLVVEDTKSTRDRVSALLSAEGYEVIQAINGGDALRVLATTVPIDAILLDLVMPSMDGWAFRELQLRDPRLAKIPTLVVTVKALAAHERYALRIGQSMAILKPFDDRELLNSVAGILGPPEPARVSDHRWLNAQGQPLLWSKRGDVACHAHAPEPGSSEWIAGGWAVIPRFAGKNKVEYACRRCGGGPIRRQQRNE
jgi:CheY-like chemotaxis protein